MKLQHLTPVLLVKDAKRSSEFYANVLGLKIKADFGGLNYIFEEGLAVWQPMEENIIPRKLGMEKITDPTATSRVEICFETMDLDGDYATLQAHGVRFLHEINVELWGQRTIRFYDPDGHLIEIGEALPAFLNRFKNEGLSFEQIAERAYMPVEMVRDILKA